MKNLIGLLRPIIGVTAESVEQLPGQLSAGWILGQHYIQPLIDKGAIPWIVPLLNGDEATLRSIYRCLDGIYLAGGADIDPSCYGEERHPQCGKTDPARDWTELQLIRWAWHDSKPILGVCRGLQMINVAVGGTLYQDLPTQLPGAIAHERTPATDDPREAISHTVRVERGSHLHDILATDATEVNSIHHQGIKDLGAGLRACAFTADGLIEGIVAATGQYVIGVQWHPEEMTGMGRLFQSFLESASQRRQGEGTAGTRLRAE